MQVLLRLDGRKAAHGGPLLMHNERLQDPLDPLAQALKEVTGVTRKTEEHHIEVARREFYGGLYTLPPIDSLEHLNGQVVGLPAWNIIRCLQDGATRSKRGKDVLRGITPVVQFVPLAYDGPKQPEKLWKSRNFDLRKGVGVARNRVMRTRPCFSEWQAALPIEVDTEVWDVESLALCWRNAGRYYGLGDMRPIYGRFEGTLEADPPEYVWNDAVAAEMDAAASERFIAYIKEKDKARRKRH